MVVREIACLALTLRVQVSVLVRAVPGAAAPSEFSIAGCAHILCVMLTIDVRALGYLHDLILGHSLLTVAFFVLVLLRGLSFWLLLLCVVPQRLWIELGYILFALQGWLFAVEKVL